MRATKQELAAIVDNAIQRMDSIQQEIQRVRLMLERTATAITFLDQPAGDIERLLKDHQRQLLNALSGGDGMLANPPTDFRVDAEGRVARVGRRRIPFTEMEFNLVERLWTQAPHPVSREALMDHLYAGSARPTDQVIDVFIFRIRQKMSAAGVNDVAITSMKGVGWVLMPDRESASAAA